MTTFTGQSCTERWALQCRSKNHVFAPGGLAVHRQQAIPTFKDCCDGGTALRKSQKCRRLCLCWSELPERKQLVVGIDLGTTNSAVAVVEGGKPSIVPSLEGLPVVPSVVCFQGDGEVVVGAAARKVAVNWPDSTFYSTKRFIGQR